MKKIYRWFSILLIMSMVLVGCGNSDNKNAEADIPQIEAESTNATETLEADTEKETIHTHAYTETITTAAICETDGVKTFACECGDSYTEPIKATGHAYGAYTYNNDATYEKDGTETTTCSACGIQNTRTKAGTKLVKEEPECPYELGVWYDMGWYFFKLYPDGASVESGSGQEYGQILNERYPDVVNTPAGTAVNMYGESKWNGWYVYWWVAVPQGKYVFYNY